MKALEWAASLGRRLAKWLAIAGGMIAAALLIRWQGAAIARLVARILPHERRGWKPVVGDPTRVSVEADDGALLVQLPKGVTSDQVVAVGASSSGWQVEVLHARRDRRAAPAR